MWHCWGGGRGEGCGGLCRRLVFIAVSTVVSSSFHSCLHMKVKQELRPSWKCETMFPHARVCCIPLTPVMLTERGCKMQWKRDNCELSLCPSARHPPPPHPPPPVPPSRLPSQGLWAFVCLSEIRARSPPTLPVPPQLAHFSRTPSQLIVQGATFPNF